MSKSELKFYCLQTSLRVITHTDFEFHHLIVRSRNLWFTTIIAAYLKTELISMLVFDLLQCMLPRIIGAYGSFKFFF